MKAKIFNSVQQYEQQAKIGDFITFEGHGIIDGLKNSNTKHDFYKVAKICPVTGNVYFREYRGKTNLSIMPHMKDQKVMVIDKKQFNELPKLY